MTLKQNRVARAGETLEQNTSAKSQDANCRTSNYTKLEGYEAVVLENDLFRLTVLPGKGSDIVELLHKPNDTDLMWWTAFGLLPASNLPTDFQSQYEGGWQEIFPNLAGSHVHEGVLLQAYGQVSLIPWSHEVVTDEPDHVAVCFSVNLQTLPFRLEKTIHVRRDIPGFQLEERAINLSSLEQYADWGHHITFGEPFLTPQTRLELPSPKRPSFVIPERGAAGGFEALADLTQGQYRLIRPDGMGARVSWDASVCPYLWFWRDFAGENVAPYFGRHFNIGLELFSSPPAERLQDNIDAGTALRFEAGQTRDFWLHFEVIHEP
jgi:catechol 2,3-dioxygenase-like lactoylglutathione lyase family enzyme